MFLRRRKRLIQDAIVNACKNNIEVYQNEAKKCAEMNDFNNLESAAFEARKKYFDAVCESVCGFFQVSSPFIAARLRLLIETPSLCGLDDDFIKNGVSAGTLYAMCYYALTDNEASSKDCMNISRIQKSLMDNALLKLDELTEHEEKVLPADNEVNKFETYCTSLELALDFISEYATKKSEISSFEYGSIEVAGFAGVEYLIWMLNKYGNIGRNWYESTLKSRIPIQNVEILMVKFDLIQKDIDERIKEYKKENGELSVDMLIRIIAYSAMGKLDMMNLAKHESASFLGEKNIFLDEVEELEIVYCKFINSNQKLITKP